jgi:ArsR family transcriptional regulator
MTPHPIDDAKFAAQLRALGHPARLAIIRALSGRDACVCGEIVRGLPLAQSTVSEHIRVLRAAELIKALPGAERAVCYGLDHAAMATLRARLDALTAAAAAPAAEVAS